jgi:hypothetical protein
MDPPPPLERNTRPSLIIWAPAGGLRSTLHGVTAQPVSISTYIYAAVLNGKQKPNRKFVVCPFVTKKQM